VSIGKSYTIGGKNVDYSDNRLTIEFDRPSVRQALGNFSNYDAKTRRKIAKAVEKSMKEIERGAKSRVPVRTSELKKHITASFDPVTMKGSITANTFYAHFSEFGTETEKAQPYMRPAYESERPNLIKGIKDAVQL